MKSEKKQFAHIRVHTEHSAGNSIGTQKRLVERAAELEFPYLGITDYGTVSGVYTFSKLCKKVGIKPVLGVELYVSDDKKHPFKVKGRIEKIDIEIKSLAKSIKNLGERSDRRKELEHAKSELSNQVKSKAYHVTAICKNMNGLKKMYKVIRDSYDYFYYKPRTDLRTLAELNCQNDVVLMFGDMSSYIAQSIFYGYIDNAIEFMNKVDEYGFEHYLELSPHSFPGQRQVNIALERMSKVSKSRLIATNNVHYPYAEDHATLEILKSLSKETRDEFQFINRGMHLRTRQEMKEAFGKFHCELEEKTYIKAINNAYKFCEENIEEYVFDKSDKIPILSESIVKGNELLFNKSMNGLKRLDLYQKTEYKDRVKFELEVITGKKFTDYFHMVEDLVSWARQQNIFVGPGRGCLDGKTKVLSENGYVNLKDIQIGDKVYSHTGVARKVTNKFEYDVKEQGVSISTEFAFNRIKLTTDHKVFGVKRVQASQYNKTGRKYVTDRWKDISNTPEWIEAKNLSVGDFLFMPFPERQQQNFQTIDLAKFASNQQYDESFVYCRTNTNTFLSKKQIARDKIACVGTLNRYIDGHTLEPNTIDRIDSGLRNKYGITLLEWKILNKQILRPVERHIKFDDEFCFIAGYWIGDGWTSHDSDFGFAFNSDHQDLIDLVYYYFYNKGFEVRKVKHKTKNLVQLIIHNSLLCELFKTLVPAYRRTSRTKHLIEGFRSLTDECLYALMLGLSYADGHIEPLSLREKISTTSRRMAFEIKEALLYLKIPSSIITRKPYKHGKYVCRKSYTVGFRGLKADKRTENVFDNGYLTKITKLEAVNLKKVYDISVDVDTSYLTTNYAVHNSVGGSLVAYALGITELDPIKHGLLFERFLTPDRNEYPDIDLDFEKDRRDEILQYLKDKYGHDRVCQIGTNLKYGPSRAIRDIAKAFGVPTDEFNDILKYNIGPLDDLSAALEYPEIAAFAKEHPTIIEHVRKICKQIFAFGIHASGVAISVRALIEDIPLAVRTSVTGSKAEATCFTDGKDDRELSELGIIKIDRLGLKTLDVNKLCIEYVKERHDVDIVCSEIPDGSKKVYKAFSRGLTNSIFQFGQRNMKRILRNVVPTRLDDLAAVNALYRPGPIGAGLIDIFTANKHDEDNIEKLHPVVDEILDRTYGIILYQEQIMEIGRRVAGYSSKEANHLRKIIKKSSGSTSTAEERNQDRDNFLTGCSNNGVDESLALKLYSSIENFASYSFNASHSFSYALLAYRQMWLKVNYPVEFMAASLRFQERNDDKQKKQFMEIIKECSEMGVKFQAPDVNEGKKDVYIGDGTIMLGFSDIKGLGNIGADKIVQYQPYESLSDFLYKIPDFRGINKTVIASMIIMGCFDAILQVDRYTAVEGLETLIKSKKSKNGILAEYELNPSKEDLDETLIDFELDRNFGFGIKYFC